MRASLALLVPWLLCCLLLHTAVRVSGIRVHLVSHSHTDVGWLKTVDQYFTGVNRSNSFGHVRAILDSVLDGLLSNGDRRFSYGEQAFFQRWYRTLSDRRRQQLQSVVSSGQLEFINGGWCMHDEATTHYTDMIDQTTLGHRFIREQFGEQANPKAGWQIDTFGHSSTHVALLTGEVGLSGLLFARIDYEDFRVRTAQRELEWIWRPSASLGQAADVFAYAFAPIGLPPGVGASGYYGCPYKFCFNTICYNGDEARPLQSDPQLDDYNVEQRVEDAVRLAQQLSQHLQGEQQMWTIGDDFYWEDANHNFKEMDKLIAAVNANGTIQMQYSTPALYIAAKQRENLTWPYKFDDELPYGAGPHSYWTGFYTSRPALKRYVRECSAALNAARHWDLYSGGRGSSVERLWEALSVAQHHDAVAGTARQAVTDDYVQRLYRGWHGADAAMQLSIARLLQADNSSAPLLSFSSCPRLNVSVCPVSQQQPAAFPLLCLVYNPLARWRQAVIVIPVSGSQGLEVLAADGSSRVASQLQPAVRSEAWTADVSAPYELRFLAALPPLGYSSFFIVNGTAGSRAAVLPAASRRQRSPSVSIENSRLLLTVNATSGLPLSLTDKQQNLTFPFSVDFLYYAADSGSSPYGFRPNGSAVSLSSTASLQAVLVGPVVSEVRVEICGWLSAVFRLPQSGNASSEEEAGQWLEVDWVVGPVPVLADAPLGVEVIARYSAPQLRSSALFYTDSNGREWQRRRRDFRQTWNLTRTDPQSQNYYPVVTGIYLQDEAEPSAAAAGASASAGASTSQQALLVLVDRAQGGSSLADGELELLLHRRLLVRALAGEALDEQEDGRPLVVRGLHALSLGLQSGVLRAARQAQQRLQAPPTVSIATLQQQSVQTVVSSYRLTASYSQQPLPPQVDIVSLYSTADGSGILRLAHQYGVDEQSTGRAEPVTVSVSSLLTQNISSITQLSLTANARYTQRSSTAAAVWRPQQVADAQRHQRDRSASGLSADGGNITLLPMEVLTFAFNVSMDTA